MCENKLIDLEYLSDTTKSTTTHRGDRYVVHDVLNSSSKTNPSVGNGKMNLYEILDIRLIPHTNQKS